MIFENQNAKIMCMIVELAKEQYSNFPDADIICRDWQKARMEALSTLPYEEVNRVLQGIDDHFNDLLDYAVYFGSLEKEKTHLKVAS